MVRTSEDNRTLRERRGNIAREMEAIVERGIRTAADRERFEQLDAEQKQLRERIERMEGGAALYTMGGGAIGATVAAEDAETRSAFRTYLKRGRSEMSPSERSLLRWDSDGEFRDMGTGGGNALQGTGGGYFVPVGFVNDVERALKFYGPMLRGGTGNPTIMDTATGQPLPYPTSNDTAVEGELVGEGVQVTTNDVSLSNVIFGAYKFSTKMVKCSIELMQDSAFDIEQFLKDVFAERLGRVINRYATTGTGVNQPTGIVTAALAGGNLVTAVGAASNTGGSDGANTIGSDDLVALEHAVDPLYRPGARYMFHDSVLKALKQVKDKYGRPLWQQSVRDSEPDTINGYEYVINNSMDQLQTQNSSPVVTKNVVLFGALGKYTIRRVRGLSVLRLSERFADYGQVAFIGFARYDGQLLDAGTHPVGVLQTKY